MTRNSVKIYCYLQTIASIQSRGRDKPFDANGCLVNSLMSPDLSAKSQGPSHDECLFRKKRRSWLGIGVAPSFHMVETLDILWWWKHQNKDLQILLLKPELKAPRGLFANGLLPQLQVKVSQASSGYQCHQRKWETRSSAHHFHNQVPLIRDGWCNSPHSMKFLSHCTITFGW